MILLSLSAFASSSTPGWFQPSAVPSSDSVSLELSAGLGGYTAPDALESRGYAAAAVVSVNATSRLRFGLNSGLLRGRTVGKILGRSEYKEAEQFLVLNTAFAMVDQPRFRVSPFVSTGTFVQAGLAIWWQTPGGRVEVDAAWGPGIDMVSLLSPPVRRSKSLHIHEITAAPDLGITVHLDSNARHDLRVATVSALPTVTYRFDPGPVALEASASYVGLANAVRLAAETSF